MHFRPCIDLHRGRVKQIVGGSLTDRADSDPVTNFESGQSPGYYADLYWRDGLRGGHVIKLGPGNDAAAAGALSVHPGSLQVGGGVTADNAGSWLDVGASKIIVTSYAFVGGDLSHARLDVLRRRIGANRIVLDLSCRRRGDVYVVACNRWQTLTSVVLSGATFSELAEYCSEFLVHAVDVEGKQSGLDSVLVDRLAEWTDVPVTYAGGIRSMEDIARIAEAGRGRIDYTVGSALDLFGGSGLKYADLVAYESGVGSRERTQTE